MTDELIYHFQLASLVEQLGEPEYMLELEGAPQGFTVTRKTGKKSKQALRAHSWAKLVRVALEHEYGVNHLVATPENPIYIHTQAWYPSKVHCDPENTHKLAKDAIFYLAPKGSRGDKYTAGSYEGPMYDSVNPRMIMHMWRLGETK